MATPIFSNKPFFDQKAVTVADVLNMQRFDVLTEANPATTSYNACGDPNLGTLWVKNVYHQLIRIGGSKIDYNFLFDMFKRDDKMVTTKRLYNHYIGRPDYNIYSANAVTGTAPGAEATFVLLRANHDTDGVSVLPSEGMQLVDKDSYVWYTITNVDTTTPFAAKISIIPNDETKTVNIQPNHQYFVAPAMLVGGCSCETLANTFDSLGWSKEVNFLRARRDWKFCIELETGYRDKFQFAVLYDTETGKPQDSWVTKESMDARMYLQYFLNAWAFMGSPTTNPALLPGGSNATIDADYKGFYGIFPEIRYGGGSVIPFASSVGFDMESDGEPFMLYQDSLKRTDSFLIMAGFKWLLGLDNRTTKMVARQGVGECNFDAYQRLKQDDKGVTDLLKLGIKSYDYRDWHLDIKKWGALSDKQSMGSDANSDTAIWMPMDGLTENGQPIDPIEFYQYGNGEYTGGYFEAFVDERYHPNKCEVLSGYVVQSMTMALHGNELWAMSTPVIDA